MARALSISIDNDISELTHLIRVVNVFLSPWALKSRTLYAVNLVLEELLSNAIKYGYHDREKHEIEVRIEIENDKIRMTTEDDAAPFNPLSIPRPDRSKPAIERIEEGLGINFVRNLMNSMEYSWENGKNILRVSIRI